MTDTHGTTPGQPPEDTSGQTAPANGNLLRFHATQLQDSAIADDVSRERGYQSISRPSPGDQRPRNLLRRLGLPAWVRDDDARFPGLLIPLYRATGEQISFQYRPDNPVKDPKTGKFRKYAAPAGRASVIDVHPRHRNAIVDPTIPLWITEGVKKADSLTSQGCCAVALSGVWNWRSHLGTLSDWEDVQLRGRHVIICYDADVRDNPQIGRAMERLGKWLRSKGSARVTYVTPPGVNGTQPKGVDDFFAAGGTYEWLCRGGASDVPPVQGGPTSADLVDPEGWMVDQLAEDVPDGSWLWCPDLGWLRYEARDGRWKVLRDKGVAVADEIRRWLKAKYADVAAGLEQASRSGAGTKELQALEFLAHAWRSVCTASRIGNLAALARGLVTRDLSDFDTHRDLMNCPNGVLDLRTMTLADHDPELYFTQVTRARYIPGARHRDWDKALEAIPADVRAYVQLRYGQGITGHPPPDNVVFVQLGKGSNGKTTVVYGCQGALGRGYFQLISDRAVIADKSQHPTELMDFRGARMAVLEELPEDRVLNMRRIKVITGPEISARYCGQDSAPYDTTHGLTISTNHDPVVVETDTGSWRRLMALRFPFRYWEPGDPEMPDPPGDFHRVAEPGLRERLRDPEPALAEAMLAWLADGAREWYEHGLGPRPDRIRRDTNAWQKASNPVFAWAAEFLTGDAGSHVWSAEAVTMLRNYLEAAGHKFWSDSVILARLTGACEQLGWRAEKRDKRERSKLGTLSRPESSWMAKPSKSYNALTGIRFRTEQDDADSRNPGSIQDEAQVSDLGVPDAPTSSGGSYTRGQPKNWQERREQWEQGLDWAALWAMADHTVDTSTWTDEQWAAHERDTA